MYVLFICMHYLYLYSFTNKRKYINPNPCVGYKCVLILMLCNLSSCDGAVVRMQDPQS